MVKLNKLIAICAAILIMVTGCSNDKQTSKEGINDKGAINEGIV